MNGIPGKGFRAHFVEATHLNLQRKHIYSQLTGGKSKRVSNILIFAEKLLFPVAWYFDMRAKRFNQQGISIIVDDFMALDNLPSPNRSPIYKNVLPCRDIRFLFATMFRLRWKVRRLLHRYNFAGVHMLVIEHIDLIANLEEERGVHIAILKHILESVAFAAKNAVGYTSMANRGAMRLASCFIKTQMLGTIMSPLIDRSANKIHKLGIGILYNDIPDIPYK